MSSCGAQYPFGLYSTCSCSITRAAGRTSLKDTLRPEAPVSSTASVPALCPCEEWRLHRSPSVVSGGSTDDARQNSNTSRCTVGNCTHLWDRLSDLQERPGRSPLDPRRGQGRLQTSGGRSGRSRGKHVPATSYGVSDFRRSQ